MKKGKFVWIFSFLLVFSLIASFLIKPSANKESIQEVMKDAVLHKQNRIHLIAGIEVNPSMISALVVCGILLLIAFIIRFVVIPKFQYVPGKFQIILETIVGYFYKLAKDNSPHRYESLGVYTFAAGMYVFWGTLWELLGVQVQSTAGHSISLPTPLADINAAIALGFLSYLFILWGGIRQNGLKGALHGLKDFSLPISMSFRLFGALLSGLLVNELVYYFVHLSYVLPVIIAVLFTLLHALIQAYVLTMLTALFYGEVSHIEESQKKKNKIKISEGVSI